MPWVVDLRSGGRERRAAVSRLRQWSLFAFSRVANEAGRKGKAVFSRRICYNDACSTHPNNSTQPGSGKALAAKGRKHDSRTHSACARGRRQIRMAGPQKAMA